LAELRHTRTAETDQTGFDPSHRSGRRVSRAARRPSSSSEVRFHAVCHADDGGVSELDGHIYDLSPESVALEFKGKSTQKGDFQMQQKAR